MSTTQRQDGAIVWSGGITRTNPHTTEWRCSRCRRWQPRTTARTYGRGWGGGICPQCAEAPAANEEQP